MKHSPGTGSLQDVYRNIFVKQGVPSTVLEIGCGPSNNTILNMPILKHTDYRIGVNLRSYSHYPDFDVVKCSAHNLSDVFEQGQFGAVICNMVFEHDSAFWKSLDQIKYVLCDGGLFVLGVPALLSKPHECITIPKPTRTKIKRFDLLNATITYRVHGAPDDYWRFTESAYKNVLMEGFQQVSYVKMLAPPLIVGYGVKCSQ